MEEELRKIYLMATRPSGFQNKKYLPIKREEINYDEITSVRKNLREVELQLNPQLQKSHKKLKKLYELKESTSLRISPERKYENSIKNLKGLLSSSRNRIEEAEIQKEKGGKSVESTFKNTSRQQSMKRTLPLFPRKKVSLENLHKRAIFEGSLRENSIEQLESPQNKTIFHNLQRDNEIGIQKKAKRNSTIKIQKSQEKLQTMRDQNNSLNKAQTNSSKMTKLDRLQPSVNKNSQIQRYQQYIDQYLLNLKQKNPQLKQEIQEDRSLFIKKAIKAIKEQFQKDNQAKRQKRGPIEVKKAKHDKIKSLRKDKSSQSILSNSRIPNRHVESNEHSNGLKSDYLKLLKESLPRRTIHNNSPMGLHTTIEQINQSLPEIQRNKNRHIYHKATDYGTSVRKTLRDNELSSFKKTVELEAKHRDRVQRVFKRKIMALESASMMQSVALKQQENY